MCQVSWQVAIREKSKRPTLPKPPDPSSQGLPSERVLIARSLVGITQPRRRRSSFAMWSSEPGDMASEKCFWSDTLFCVLPNRLSGWPSRAYCEPAPPHDHQSLKKFTFEGPCSLCAQENCCLTKETGSTKHFCSPLAAEDACSTVTHRNLSLARIVQKQEGGPFGVPWLLRRRLARTARNVAAHGRSQEVQPNKQEMQHGYGPKSSRKPPALGRDRQEHRCRTEAACKADGVSNITGICAAYLNVQPPLPLARTARSLAAGQTVTKPFAYELQGADAQQLMLLTRAARYHRLAEYRQEHHCRAQKKPSQLQHLRC